MYLNVEIQRIRGNLKKGTVVACISYFKLRY